MRVTNNLLVFNPYKRNTQNNHVQHKSYMQNTVDTVSFSARFKAPRQISEPAIFNQATQDTVQSIYAKLKTVKKFFADMLPAKASHIKQEYEPLLIYKGNKGHTFMLKDNPDGIETLTVARSNKNSNLIRIVVRDKDKNATHFLIDGLDKSVANINQNAPFMMPPSFRYMSAEEITNSGVKKYITLADEELTKYAEFLENYGKPNKAQEVVQELPKPAKVAEVVEAKLPEIKPNKLINIFDTPVDKLPKHINPQVSPSSGKMVGFTLNAEDGSTIRVIKTMNPNYGDQLKYISIRKTTPSGEKQYISVDLLNKELLKTDQLTGKPIIENDTVYHYTPQELARENVAENFEAIMKEIFRSSKASDKNLSQEITVLKIKEKPQPKKVKEVSIEDIEDARLNAILDKENAMIESVKTDSVAPKKRGRKPKIKTEEVSNPETTSAPKKRGRKPKVKIESPVETSKAVENQVSKKAEIPPQVLKYQEEVIAKAAQEADNLAELYFKTFVSRFKETLGKKMADFKAKYDELFNI
ncbi:MAG: hypothetical protein E7Z93_07580 [Cyanobacteria bacterium SIG32]|nr:hypothetical protein [Cyanobacteria bacterium SIG32]